MPATATFEPVPPRSTQNTQADASSAPVLPVQTGPVTTVPAATVPIATVPITTVPEPVPPQAMPSSAARGPAPAPSAPPEPFAGAGALTAACIDDLLGPARGRYFGEGYRKVGHDLCDVVIDADRAGPDGIGALAWIGYPADWAVKRTGIDLRPHVSSLDTLVIGAQLCEAYLVHRYGLDTAARRRMWLRRVDVKAGHHPQEDLAGFPVSARRLGVRPLEDRPGTYASTFDCLVGSMRIRCEVAHEATEAPRRAGRYPRLGMLLGPADRRYYGAGYRDRGYEIRDVSVDPCNTYAECSVRRAGGGETPSTGLEAHYQPCVTMAESVMMTAQLSEVILYRTDGLDRSRTNTMWLRSLRMERLDPPAPRTGAEFSGSIAVSKSRVVTLNGALWRIVDMVAYCQGIEQSHSLAHELPASADPYTVESGIVRADMAHHGELG